MEHYIQQFINTKSEYYSYFNLIKSIDNVRVKCYLGYDNCFGQDRYRFDIYFAGINDEDNDILGTKIINAKSSKKSRLAKDMAEELLKYIKNIKFNKFEGYFEENESVEIKLIKELKEIENVELHGDECCVCYEKTIKKTCCGHNLCFVCWSGIKVERDDSRKIIISCPMCRENIYNGEADYDSDYEHR